MFFPGLLLSLLLGLTTQKSVHRPAGHVTFRDVARQAGINFVNVFGGAKAKRYLLETTGSGAAWIDYDRDGYPDLFLVNGTTIEGFQPDQAPTNRLFHNNHDGTFTDMTAKAGLLHSGWGQGVCVGDYDNDGWDDIFVTYYGKNLLYHNNGNGTFTEVAEAAGVAGEATRWNTGCAFIDYDHDGRLDLFVASYVDQGPDFRLLPQPGSGQFCQYKGIPMACGPRGLKSGRNFLYRNNGDGTFTDQSERSGILLPDKHYALGVATLDYDNDGWDDIYVACDSTPSILYHNNHNGTFTDVAFVAGAFAMGLGTHPNYLGWGIGFLDYDNDGWPDLFMANGHLSPEIDPFHIDTMYAQRKLLYHNVPGPAKGRTFMDVSTSSGPGIQLVSSSRGVAFADYDNDGRVDIAINNMNGPALLLRNEGGNGNHWIEIMTVGRQSNRDGIGTRLEVTVGAQRQIDEVRSGGSYISQNDLRLHFGLGSHAIVDEIRLRWPSGHVDRLENVTADRIITVEEGQAQEKESGARRRKSE